MTVALRISLKCFNRKKKMAKLKIKRGKKYLIKPIDSYGTVVNIRKDDLGEEIIDLELEDDDTYIARSFELSK